MRKGIWSAATAVVLLSIATIAGYPRALAAPTTVSMVDGEGDPTTQWKFEPADISVPAGTTVKWHNTGKQSHTVTADDGSFDSGYVAEGGDFERAFPAPGNYAYHCAPHPWMKAVVHVTGGGSPAPSAPASTPAGQAPSATPSTTAPAPATKQAAAAGPSTTTTAPAGGSGPTTTTTVAPAAAGATTSTTAAAATPASATASPSTPAEGSATGTPAAAATGSGENASATHRLTDRGETDGPLVALAAVLTLALVAISGRLLVGKSRPH
jgi:plastocyanin